MDDIVKRLEAIPFLIKEMQATGSWHAATLERVLDIIGPIADDLIARLRGADGWQCRCGCHTYARVDVDTTAGFKPGDFVRCVSCKAVSYFPECAAAPPASPAPQSDVLAEIENLVEATLTRGDLQYGLGQIADVARRARRGA